MSLNIYEWIIYTTATTKTITNITTAVIKMTSIRSMTTATKTATKKPAMTPTLTWATAVRNQQP